MLHHDDHRPAGALLIHVIGNHSFIHLFIQCISTVAVKCEHRRRSERFKSRVATRLQPSQGAAASRAQRRASSVPTRRRGGARRGQRESLARKFRVSILPVLWRTIAAGAGRASRSHAGERDAASRSWPCSGSASARAGHAAAARQAAAAAVVQGRRRRRCWRGGPGQRFTSCPGTPPAGACCRGRRIGRRRRARQGGARVRTGSGSKGEAEQQQVTAASTALSKHDSRHLEALALADGLDDLGDLGAGEGVAVHGLPVVEGALGEGLAAGGGAQGGGEAE